MERSRPGGASKEPSLNSDANGDDLRALQAKLAAAEARLAEEQAARAELARRSTRLELENELSHQISLAETKAAFYRTAAHYTKLILPAVERASVALVTPGGERLSLFAIEGSAEVLPEGAPIPFEGSMVGLVARERLARRFVGDDFAKSTGVDAQRLYSVGIRSAMLAPLVTGNRLLGTLNAASRSPEAFSDDDVKLLTWVATILAVHVERWRLLAEVQESLEEARRHEEELRRELADREAAEREQERLRRQIDEAQRERLSELSTPIIPITDSVLIVPLIGYMDAERGALLLETVLEGVRAHAADIVILDITGMSDFDTAAAASLITTASALKLLGAQTMLTGVSPGAAQTLVRLGIDFGALTPHGTLKGAVRVAIDMVRAKKPALPA